MFARVAEAARKGGIYKYSTSGRSNGNAEEKFRVFSCLIVSAAVVVIY